MILFSTLTKNLSTLLIVLSTCQHLLKNDFHTIFPIKKIFKEAAIYYEDTLNKAGYINKLVYHTQSASSQENKSKNRQRNVKWFNPSYSKSVTTRIGQSFLHLLDTYFPKNHIFNKIFNRNKVTVSCSSIQRIKAILITTGTFSTKITKSKISTTAEIRSTVL